MKNILYLVSTLQSSGPTNQLSYIIKNLDRKKYNPIVLTLSPEKINDSQLAYFENSLRIRVDSLGATRFESLFLRKRLRKYLEINNIDLVHSQGIRSDGVMSKIATVPRVATLRNYPFYDYPMTYGFVVGWVMAKIHLRYLSCIDEARVVSYSISKMLKEKNDYSINYVRNGIDLSRFNGLEKTTLRKRLNLGLNDILFISVGHLTSRKDPLTIIDGFKKANVDNSKLLFLGDGELKDKCKSLASDDDDIIVVGNVKNVHEYLGASDYFVSASLAEGLPNTVLEAMACGLPCILSNIPPHLEINEINRNSSLIFDVDKKNIHNKIIEITSLDYDEMSNACLDITKKSLSAEIMASNYEEVYQSLL